ncbi:MAG: prolyl aminopeptidase [Actinomycetota bacterium]
MLDHTPEPTAAGLLDVGDGHAVYWETVGRDDGVPVVYLHGGPGGGASPGIRRWFDPDVFLAVLFDQRGCGRSRPLAEEPDHDLSVQTTDHLIADLEALRSHLGVERWLVLGLSWGSTLALAYAQAHPDTVRGLVLGAVTTTSPEEVSWITTEVGAIFPEAWDEFAANVPAGLRDRPLVDAYGELLTDPDPAVVEAAALAWCRWEDVHVSLTPGYQSNPRFDDPAFRVRFAKLVTHYWRHHGFRSDRPLLAGAADLGDLPGVLIHGRLDVSGPLRTPWELAKVWPGAELTVMEDGGHGGAELPKLCADALVRLAASTD